MDENTDRQSQIEVNENIDPNKGYPYIDPHTGYPMRFERRVDRWSPVYVRRENRNFDYLIIIVFAVFLASMIVSGL